MNVCILADMRVSAVRYRVRTLQVWPGRKRDTKRIFIKLQVIERSVIYTKNFSCGTIPRRHEATGVLDVHVLLHVPLQKSEW